MWLTFYVWSRESFFFSTKLWLNTEFFNIFFRFLWNILRRHIISHQTHCKMFCMWLIPECTERTVRRKNKQAKVEEKKIFKRKVVNFNRSPKGSAHFQQIWMKSMHFLRWGESWEEEKKSNTVKGKNTPRKPNAPEKCFFPLIFAI